MESNFMDRFNVRNDIKVPAAKGTREEEIKAEFLANADKFWGNVVKTKVIPTRSNQNGVEYYLVIADFEKEGNKFKLLQEWFISLEDEIRVSKNKITILDDVCDEIALELCERWGN